LADPETLYVFGVVADAEARADGVGSSRVEPARNAIRCRMRQRQVDRRRSGGVVGDQDGLVQPEPVEWPPATREAGPDRPVGCAAPLVAANQ
jgi:hypothetical protein